MPLFATPINNQAKLIMNIVSSAFATFFLGALAIHAMPPETVENTEALPPSFDIAMPALPDPVGLLEEGPVRLAAKT